MNALGWLIVLVGPALCAASGAGVAHLFWLRRAERWMDDCWAEAYERGRYDQALHTGSMTPEPRTVPITKVLAPRHAAPAPSPDAAWADAAVASVRARFARIRADLLGPPALEVAHIEYEAQAALIVAAIPTE